MHIAGHNWLDMVSENMITQIIKAIIPSQHAQIPPPIHKHMQWFKGNEENTTKLMQMSYSILKFKSISWHPTTNN